MPLEQRRLDTAQFLEIRGAVSNGVPQNEPIDIGRGTRKTSGHQCACADAQEPDLSASRRSAAFLHSELNIRDPIGDDHVLEV